LAEKITGILKGLKGGLEKRLGLGSEERICACEAGSIESDAPRLWRACQRTGRFWVLAGFVWIIAFVVSMLLYGGAQADTTWVREMKSYEAG